MMWSANCPSMKFKCPPLPAEDHHSSGQTHFDLWFLTRNRSECGSWRTGQTLESSAPTLVPPTVHKSGIAPQNVRELDATRSGVSGWCLQNKSSDSAALPRREKPPTAACCCV